MREKPTWASVTSKPCRCSYLNDAAADEANPIVFDERTGEFQFTYFEEGGEFPSMLIIFHCPFCGGTAPKSKRPELFKSIPRDEEERLASILQPIATIDDALTQLGIPDTDSHSKSRQYEREGKVPTVQYFRMIQYNGLSDVAIVSFTERSDGKAYWQLQGKPK